MNKADIKQKLIKDGIFYGKKYIIRGTYGWDKDEEFKLIHYDICEDMWVEEGGEKFVDHFTHQSFSMDNVDEAIKYFMEKENE